MKHTNLETLTKDQLIEIILGQEDAIKQLEEVINKLKEQLSRNSQNSSKPPSTDQFGKKPKPKSERERTGRKAGGQPGHKGVTLEQSANPDIIVPHDVTACSACHYDLSEVMSEEEVCRQEYEIPQIKPQVIEHRMALKTCPQCSAKNLASAPKGITKPVQYGSNVHALVSYFHYEQLIPLSRIKGMFEDLFGLFMSEGTLVNMHAKMNSQLSATVAILRNDILNAPVGHFDETSIYVTGKTQWLHVASNESSTIYGFHQKRGTQAIDALDILPQYKGVAVHDHWQSYFNYDNAAHALCNAHHLRELRGTNEDYAQPWAQEMRLFLLHVNKTVNEFKEAGKTELTEELLQEYSTTYDAILQRALTQIPILAKPPNKRGRAKKHPSMNLYNRLINKKKETLLFIYDFNVPFTNNLAERDIRMTKVKQKISGCFRSTSGADRFCVIRSCISTARKRGINVLHILQQAAKGLPIFIA